MFGFNLVAQRITHKLIILLLSYSGRTLNQEHQFTSCFGSQCTAEFVCSNLM